MSQPSQQPSYNSPGEPPRPPPQQSHQQSQQNPYPYQSPTAYTASYNNARGYSPSLHTSAPRDYSNPQSINSPYLHSVPPPSKRQRMSPSDSPHNSPNFANISLPSQIFSNYGGSHVNGAMPTSSPATNGSFYNTINSVAQSSAPQNSGPNVAMASQAGSMGPPSRPNDKPTDMTELADVLLGSGVDLREEEAALMRGNQKPGNVPARSDQNFYSNNIPGGAESFYGAGAFNQPAITLQTAEEQAKAAAERRVREHAQRNQYHLNNPFLQTAPLERRIRKEHQKHQMPYNIGGQVLHRQAGESPQNIYVAGPDGNEMLTTIRDEPLLYDKSPLVDFISLLSLACEERIRAMIEKAAAAAHNRYTSSSHIVPYGMQDIATGDGEPETVPVPSESDTTITGDSLKRSYSSMNSQPTPMLDGVRLPTTIRYPNDVLKKLHESAVAEREAYIDMLWARHKREAAKAIKEAEATAAALTSGEGEVAPEVEAAKKGSLKKEQRKQIEAKASEAQQAAATNRTMNMMISNKKAPAWLSGAGLSKGGGAPSVTARPSSTALSKGAPKSRADIANSLPPIRPWGQFKETKAINMRDIMFVMEGDTAAKKVLGMCYLRRNSPGGMTKGWN